MGTVWTVLAIEAAVVLAVAVVVTRWVDRHFRSSRRRVTEDERPVAAAARQEPRDRAHA